MTQDGARHDYGSRMEPGMTTGPGWSPTGSKMEPNRVNNGAQQGQYWSPTGQIEAKQGQTEAKQGPIEAKQG